MAAPSLPPSLDSPWSLLSCLLVCLHLVAADPVLRFKGDSCNSLEPQYVEENWQQPTTGAMVQMEEEEASLFDSAQKSRERNPPYSLELDFSQYRRGREYTVTLRTQLYYDAFIIQARGRDRPDGNATLVGEWLDLPVVASYLTCLGNTRATVTDKGRPVLLGNLSLTWQAPETDYGDIRFVLSVVRGTVYTEVTSATLTFNSFPVSIRGCGRQMSCFRRCSGGPTCPQHDTDFTVVLDVSKDRDEFVISLGGTVREEAVLENGQEDMDNKTGGAMPDSMGLTKEPIVRRLDKYVAVGFGWDKTDLKNMDMAACYMEGNEVRLGHYWVENKDAQPYMHRAELTLDKWDLDTVSGRTDLWCQFRRPVRPDTIWDLDLSLKMFQFYFTGLQNQSMLHLPERKMIWDSGVRRNFSEITNDISFRDREGRQEKTESEGLKSSGSLHLATVIIIVISVICSLV